MGLLTNLVTIGAPIAAALVINIASSEISAWAPTWAKWIVARAARHLPEAERTAAEAEWLAHVEQLPGNVAKVFHAFGMWRTAAFSRVTAEFVFKAVDGISIPFILVMSIFSTAWDYFSGHPYGYLVIDIIPGLSALTTTVGAIAVHAWRGRRTRNSSPPSVKR